MYLVASVLTYEITPPDDDQDQAWPYQGDSGVSVSPVSLHASKPQAPHEDLTVTAHSTCRLVAELSPGDDAYVVIATWTDGDTFGSSGYWGVLAVCSNPQDAADAESAAREGPPAWPRQPWWGYFAHLDGIEIHQMKVLA